jgi:outer membrane immunogenic protein
MTKILLSTVAFVGLTAGALAADLPVHKAPPAPLAAVPVFTWTGLYVGVNGGVAFQDDENDRRRNGHHGGYGNYDGHYGDYNGHGRRGRDDTSILGGGQIGYNMQFGMFVAGVEADLQAIDFQRVNPALNPGRNRNRDNDDDVDLFGTVRGRLGLAAFDRALIYVTGGLAWKADEDSNGRFRRNNGSDDIGFTVGGGVEYAFTNNLSLKVEGLYVDFSDDNNDRDHRNRNLARADFDNSREFGLVRAGLNWRFTTF